VPPTRSRHIARGERQRAVREFDTGNLAVWARPAQAKDVMSGVFDRCKWGLTVLP